MIAVRPTMATIASNLDKMSAEGARRRWALLVGAAFAHECREPDFVEMLDFNARLATILRRTGVAKKIWGDDVV